MASSRRLAAILLADVAGYSRLMQADEQVIHDHLMASRRELVDPRIQEHHGRIVKYTGDGFLAEFPSVLEAVRCAVEVQCAMHHRNEAVAEAQRVRFRIGINLGDVIVEPEDIYGDGVNIAARLEAMAEPNGICISQVVHEQIRDRLPFAFVDLGPRAVKNLARPLHAFALGAEAIAVLPPPDIVTPPAGTVAARAAWQIAGSWIPAPRLSIVVLPFANLSNNQEDQYLAEAITDDVMTDLSRIPEMIVISRTTAATYAQEAIDVRRIGRELNIRYVLEGSLRRAGRRVRVNVRLVDAERDVHVWAERFDYDTDDLFVLQDQITSQIAVALNLELVEVEAARPGSHPDALDYILRGRAALYDSKGVTREGFAQAVGHFETALSLDPASIETKAFLAAALAGRVLDQLSDTAAEDIGRAERLIEQVLAVSPRHHLARFAKAQLLRAQRQYEAAIPEYEVAIAANRNWVVAIAALGICKFLAGRVAEAIPAQELAIRLSPRDPRLPNWYWRIGMVHLLQSRPEEAIVWLRRADSANPRLPGPHAWLASAYALTGETERAAAELGEARRLSGDRRYASIACFTRSQAWSPKTRALAEDTFFAGLRKAGVPQED